MTPFYKTAETFKQGSMTLEKKYYIEPIFAQLVQKIGTMKLLHWHYDKNILCLKYNNLHIKESGLSHTS